MRTGIDVERILCEEGVIARRDHPELAGALDWLLRCGLIRPVLPGVYAATDRADDFEIRVAAVGVWHRDAVITGRAAARLTFWDSLTSSEVEVASTGCRPISGELAVRRRTVPPELILERPGMRLTSPALTALDLAVVTEGESVDTVLRARRATLADLHEALLRTPGRKGNSGRRRLLLDSRAEPWSVPERRAHRELRAAGIEGWQANFPVTTDGALYYLDLAFEAERLGIEIDGREHHGPATFDADRWRQNAIILDGWHLLRFSADVVTNEPARFVEQVAEARLRWRC